MQIVIVTRMSQIGMGMGQIGTEIKTLVFEWYGKGWKEPCFSQRASEEQGKKG